MGAHRPTSPRPLQILPAECKRVWNRDVAARRSRPLVQGALHWPSLAGVAGEAATPPQARTGRPAGGPRLRARRRPRSRQQRAVSSGSGPPTAPLLPCQQPGRWEDSHVLPRLRAGRNRRMPRLRTRRVHFHRPCFVCLCLPAHPPSFHPRLIFLTSSHKGACRHRRGWGAEPRSQERGGGGCFEDGREVDGWACAPSAGRGGAGGRQHARAVYGVGRDEGWVRHMLKRPAARTGKRCRAAPSMRVQGGGCVLLGRGTETRDGDGREHVSRPARQQENKKWGQEGGGRRAQRPVSARRAPRVPLSQSWSGRHSCPWRWRT